MIPNHSIFRYLSLLLIVLPVFGFISAAVAENNDLSRPTISIELLVVPEKEACKPKGYKSYNSDKDLKCKKLSIEDIENWKDVYGYYGRTNIPPSEVILGKDLLNLLNNYSAKLLDDYKTAGQSDSNKRQSIVLVFDWQSQQNLSIDFERVVDVTGSVPIIDMKWNGKLVGERRWIHHERLDAFLPGYNIRWILTAGGSKWEFNTKE